MAKFISVLDSDMNEDFWTAVQWAETRAEIDNNRFYTAGVNLSLPRDFTNDKKVGEKTIKETRTGQIANAGIIRLSTQSTTFLKIANNTASIRLINKISKSGNDQ